MTPVEIIQNIIVILYNACRCEWDADERAAILAAIAAELEQE